MTETPSHHALPRPKWRRKEAANTRASAGSPVGNWRRFVPETLAIIVLLIVFDRFLMNGSAFSASLHPFWIPVVLMAAQYGVVGGLFATVAVTVALCAIDPPPQTVNQDFYTYAGALLGQPVGWLASVMVIGGIRNLHMAHSAEMQESLDEARGAAETLNAGLDRAVAEIERLERRIAGEIVSIDGVMQALASLDPRDMQTLVASFAGIVRDGVGAESLTLYLQEAAGVMPVARIVDGDTGDVSAAPNLSTPLLSALSAERGTVVHVDPDARQLLPSGSVCVAPIISDPGHVFLGAIIIERLQPGQDVRRAALRTELLGKAVGKLLRAMFSRFRGFHPE